MFESAQADHAHENWRMQIEEASMPPSLKYAGCVSVTASMEILAISFAHINEFSERRLAFAVALRSMLDADFIFGTDSTPPEELDRLYESASSQDVDTSNERTAYTIVVHPAVPEQGIVLKVSCCFTSALFLQGGFQMLLI